MQPYYQVRGGAHHYAISPPSWVRVRRLGFVVMIRIMVRLRLRLKLRLRLRHRHRLRQRLRVQFRFRRSGAKCIFAPYHLQLGSGLSGKESSSLGITSAPCMSTCNSVSCAKYRPVPAPSCCQSETDSRLDPLKATCSMQRSTSFTHDLDWVSSQVTRQRLIRCSRRKSRSSGMSAGGIFHASQLEQD